MTMPLCQKTFSCFTSRASLCVYTLQHQTLYSISYSHIIFCAHVRQKGRQYTYRLSKRRQKYYKQHCIHVPMLLLNRYTSLTISNNSVNGAVARDDFHLKNNYDLLRFLMQKSERVHLLHYSPHILSIN